MLLLAQLVECAGLALYCALVLWCTAGSLSAVNSEPLAPLYSQRIRLRLSLSVAIAALAATVAVGKGRFLWSDFPPWGQLTLLLLLALVCSHTVLEHTTLRHRPLFSQGEQQPGYLSRVQGHLLLQSLLGIALWLPWLAAST